jgi:hypothetical protein
LRKLLLAVLTIGLAQGAAAEPGTKTPVAAEAGKQRGLQDLYILCAFYPKPGTCDEVYRQAMTDNGIGAEAVRAEYTSYVRYLGGSEKLTDADHRYLQENAILMPLGLSAANQAGLHKVINDPSMKGDAKRAAVNNFLGRAVQAELYCKFTPCDGPATS